MPKIILVGLSGVSKSKFVEYLGEIDWLLAEDDLKDCVYALDDMSDYRTELLIAVSRMESQDMADIYLRSLIDSLAYTSARYRRMVEQNVVSEEEQFRWWLTVQTIAAIFRDSFRYDTVIYFAPMHTDDLTPFLQDVDEAYKTIFHEFQIKTINVGPNAKANDLEVITKTLKNLYATDGQADDSSES